MNSCGAKINFTGKVKVLRQYFINFAILFTAFCKHRNELIYCPANQPAKILSEFYRQNEVNYYLFGKCSRKAGRKIDFDTWQQL